MVDSIEIRLGQLTEAIKGLYAKSSMSQGEIYNALTSLTQRYENLTNVSSEKIAATLVDEFRKTIDLKYGQTNQSLKDLEAALKTLLANPTMQNSNLGAEVARLISDTSNIYAKLNSQDLALQKIFNAVEFQKNNNGNSEEIIRLSENFQNFSRGFDNITQTLNKNFAELVSQIKQQDGSKDEMFSMQGELDEISGNIHSVVSAISVIDSKYKDLTGLIDTIKTRENLFNDALREVQTLSMTVNSIKEDLSYLNVNGTMHSFGDELKEQIENVKHEIQKVINTAGDAGVKAEVYNLTNNVVGITNNIQNLGTNIANTNDEVKNLASTVQNLGSELKDVHNLINDEILYKTHQHETDFERYLNSAKEDIKTLLIGLTRFKKDLSAINDGNIKLLQEPIERALADLQNQDLGKNIKELADNLRDVTLEIQSSIQNMQNSLNDMSSVSSMQILTQISEAIPTISDKLEIFRTHVVTENSTSLGQVKTSFSEVVASIKEDLANTVEKIQDETRTISIETVDTLKVDLQKLSDHLVDSVETISEKVEKEFASYKNDFQEFSIKQQTNTDTITDKLTILEVGLENFSRDTIDKINDTINTNSAHAQDVLNEIKSDILESVCDIEKSNKTSLNQFEAKIDKILDDYLGADLDTISNKKSLRETVVDIETKIDRTNLQQIHNAKELLEEIQSSASNLNMKIASIEESKSVASVLSALSKVSDKVKSIEEFNIDLSDELKQIKEQLEQKLKDNVQKISALIERESFSKNNDNSVQNLNIDNLSNKVQEYLSNFEFLKSNISQEIKENLSGEFSKIENAIRRIRTTDESSNYLYTLEDVESDLAKMRLTIEKHAAGSDDFKNLFEKIVELRTVGLENVKINRDIETEIGHLTGWFKDVVGKMDDLGDRFDEMKNNAFEEIRTRLIQSEKSKNNQEETRVEAAVKHLIKGMQNQDVRMVELNRKIELLAQAQSENFNPAQFIDIFYENMTQTKMLSNRIEIIEDKISSVQNTLERLVGYLEQ